jgi:hypothetical protein
MKGEYDDFVGHFWMYRQKRPGDAYLLLRVSQ